MNAQPFSPGCPPQNRLVAFLDGSLSGNEWSSVASHLPDCDRCQQQLDELEQYHPASLAMLKQRGESFPFIHEAGLQQLESAACHILSGGNETHRLAKEPTPQLLPEQIGQYRLLEKLGEGGMGAVYRALHVNLKCEVALKLLPEHFQANPRCLSRFYREMEAVGRVNSDYVVRASDAGEADGRHYLVMEYLPGIDLERLLRLHGPLPIADACEFARQASLGLAAIDRQGLVHRDIKPSNLMLTTGGKVKILDLGLARLLSPTDEDGDLTQSDHILGTVGYLAPEQITCSREADIRADIYSLGCSLYKLVAGHSPFPKKKYQSPHAKMMAHLLDDPPLLSAVRSDTPAELSDLVARMMERDVDQRIASPREVIDALSELAETANPSRLFEEFIGQTESTDDLAANTNQDLLPTKPYVPVSPSRRKVWTRRQKLSAGLLVCGVVGIALWALNSMPGPAGFLSLVASVDDSPGANSKEPTSNDPTAPVAETLPFDVSDEEMGVWHNLLSREPHVPGWQSNSLDSLIQPLLARRQVYLSSKPYCFAELGAIYQRRYRLQLRIDQTHWQGGVGVFIGMRPDVDEQGKGIVRFQLFELRPAYPNDAARAYAWRRSKGTIAFTEAGLAGVNMETCAVSTISKPAPKAQLLEIAVQPDGLIEFAWAGQQLPNLCDEAADTKFVPADYDGSFGVSVGNSDAMIRDASILIEGRVTNEK